MRIPRLIPKVAYLLCALTLGTSAIAAPPADLTIEQLTSLRRQSSAGLATLEDRRLAFERLMAAMPVDRQATFAADEIGGIPGTWARSGGGEATANVVVYLHGGGFYSGSSSTHRNVAAALSARSNADVFVLDYRLAPRSKYPAQLDDAEQVYEAMRARGYPGCAIALASDSAGGLLAADLTVRLKKRSAPLPSSLFLMSPVFDFSGSSRSMQDKGGTDPIISAAGVRNSSAAAFGITETAPLAQAWSEDLTGFPPTLIQVGADEALLDDALIFAQKEANAGVPIKLATYRGVLHQWQIFPTNFAPARAALAEGGRFLQEHFCR
ncbi:alpha/beta hydrolase [Mitsuaria sp. CC2]|uniref:alpha/beta hydrolase n=1 Tax=Mitsuaria sp. CC2 TaxID=3029186 RepID=UPI003B8C6FA3